jgi:hypothetical protein
MEARRAFVLNLDADVELAAGARGYAPTKRVLTLMRPHVETLARTLLAPTDLLVDQTTAPGAAQGLLGHAFCPTPRALSLLARAGATLAPHPSFDVLRAVNSRAFASSLGTTMEGAAFVTSLEAAATMLAASPRLSSTWRVKRAFGMTGRGQRRVSPGQLDDAERAFMAAGVVEGGVQIEPDVEIVVEYAIHGCIVEGEPIQLGQIVKQRCDAHGAWIATEPLPPSEQDEALREALNDEGRRVGIALRDARYVGPFGVDAFTYRDCDGNLLLQPRSEINARYSMGWPVGMGRPA